MKRSGLTRFWIILLISYCGVRGQNDKLSSDCDCGWKKQVRIVGGVETGVNEFPMVAGLVDLELKIVFCGATIIDKRWVITAAHCLVAQKTDNVMVLVGEHNIKLDDSPATRVKKVAGFVIHPNYSNGYDYDLALVNTVSDILFSDRVGPACLPFKFRSFSFDGEIIQVAGWGTQAFAGMDSDYLQMVSLNIIDKVTCEQKLSKSGKTVNQRTLCTYTPGKDACQHDSGGPLLWQEAASGRVFLVGVIMGGYGCATSRPGLSSRVTEYLPWILQSTPGAVFCDK